MESPEEGRVFSMRIVNIDYYMAPPLMDMDESYSHFLGREVTEVPVVRIYGSTVSGQTTCLHLHKAFPYFYVPYDDDLPQNVDEALAYVRRLAFALEKSMKLASNIGARRQHIHSCKLVRAKKFYGYYPSENIFIKVVLYHPQEVSRMSALLLSGGILSRKFQAYEAHIPYLLQILIDHNLSGMSRIQLSDLRFRSPVPGTPKEKKRLVKQVFHGMATKSFNDEDNASNNAGNRFTSSNEAERQEFWLVSNIPSQCVWSAISQGSGQKGVPSRSSTCELEADATVEDILNRNALLFNPLAQSGPERRMVQSLISIWEERKGVDGVVIPCPRQPEKLSASSPSVKAFHKELVQTVREAEGGEGNTEEIEQLQLKISSLQGAGTSANLLENSQPANSKGSWDTKESLEEVMKDVNSFEEPMDGYTESLNGNQILESKVTDEEALELLKWMVSSQTNEDEDDATTAKEQDHGEMELCKLFEGDGVEAALKRTFSTYEIASQKECQDILDCSEAEAGVDVNDEVSLLLEDDGSETSSSVLYRRGKIPQYDGSWDEESYKPPVVSMKLTTTMPEENDKLKVKASSLSHSAKRTLMKNDPSAWGALPLTVRGCLSSENEVKSEHTAVNQEDDFSGTPEHLLVPPQDQVEESRRSSEASVRDLMRLKRGRRSHKKDLPLKLEPGNVNDMNNFGALTPNKDDVPQLATLRRCGTSSQSRGTQYGSLPLIRSQLPRSSSEQAFTFHKRPPNKEHILASFEDHGLKPIEYEGVFYGTSKDVSERSIFMAGLKFDQVSKSVVDLPPFVFRGREVTKCSAADRTYVEKENFGLNDAASAIPTHFESDGTILYLLTPSQAPPSSSSVVQWLAQERLTRKHLQEAAYTRSQKSSQSDATTITRPASPKYDERHVLSHEQEKVHQTPASKSPGASSSKESPRCITAVDPKRNSREFSQITAPSLAPHQFTPLSQAGFRDPATGGGGQQITLMSIEVFAETRGNLRPDPRYDAITCIVVVLQDDDAAFHLRRESIVLLYEKVSDHGMRDMDGLMGCEVVKLSTEVALLQCFIQVVRAYDPDMLIGWEIQRLSIGFLAERAANLGIGLLVQISRTPPIGVGHGLSSAFFNESHDEKQGGVLPVVPDFNHMIVEDEWGRTHGSGIYVGGRTVLNLWRVMRGELKLANYSIESVAEAVLKRRIPRISWRDLTIWFTSGPGRSRFRSIEYFINRAGLNLQIIDQLDLVNRTAELARVFGIDFFSVFSRGSQYRVESMMLRLAHSQNFLAISPSKEQVAAQPAMECLPLVMEPESRFYSSPVVVLDFQSLYPSMIIAYNLCFSTCLGKCVPMNPKVLGVTSLWIQPDVLSKLVDQLIITPNGVMFVPPQVTPGVLPRLLHEILSTRIMVKNEMKKLLPSQRVRHRVLNARQFALKLIANVTYGYAAAGFSGRMPCAELADSIVQLGRHTLERAINMVNSNPAWGARVVYGDTDSMFVLLEGRTRDEAFRIGQEIASSVTAVNPDPVTLKMEKVYHPCVLLTKKRYVGYSYESPTQVTPTFDAKGIETVRRDSCAAVAKTMEKSLRILFETCDLSQVKHYLQRQWQKILSGRISVQDFIFSKEVRLGTYSTKASVLPPAAIVASKAIAADPRAEPCYGERIQYVVVHGKPGARLVDMVVDPYMLLDDTKGLRLHDTYYINKQIVPALQRVFGLVGIDLRTWLSDMPRIYRPPVSKRPRTGSTTYYRPAQVADESSDFLKGTIDHYYLSQHCAVCGVLIHGQRQLVCQACSANPRLLTLVLLGRESRLEKEYRHIQAICNHCGGGDATGQISCISLDCGVMFERLKLKREFESSSTVSTMVSANLELY